MKKLVFAILAVLALYAAKSQAQPVIYEGCRDFSGMPVASVASNVNNVAVAVLTSNGTPVIYYNPQILSSFRPVTRRFWYMHECAHHALGHTIGSAHPFVREKEADCWAICTLDQLGELNPQTMAIIQQDIGQLPGDGWVYLPGPHRAISFGACLRNICDSLW